MYAIRVHPGGIAHIAAAVSRRNQIWYADSRAVGLQQALQRTVFEGPLNLSVAIAHGNHAWLQLWEVNSSFHAKSA